MQTDNQNVFPSPEPVKTDPKPVNTPINQYNQVSVPAQAATPAPTAPAPTQVVQEPVKEVEEVKPVEPNKTTTSFSELLAET